MRSLGRTYAEVMNFSPDVLIELGKFPPRNQMLVVGFFNTVGYVPSRPHVSDGEDPDPQRQ